MFGQSMPQFFDMAATITSSTPAGTEPTNAFISRKIEIA
jgi:hypothetical protein